MSLQLVHRQRAPDRKAMFQFQTFCGIYTLRTGSIIIGIISAACALGGLAGAEALAALATWRSWADGQRWAARALALGLDAGFVDANLRDAFSQHRFASRLNVHVFLHMYGAVEAFYFHFSLLLLYGIYKGRPSLALLWVRASLVAMGARVLLALPLAAQALAAGLVTLGASALVLVAVAAVPVAYFALVVHNYHAEMLSQKFLRAYAYAEVWVEMR